MSEVKRLRKTIEPCLKCGLHLKRCLCSEMPSLNLKTKLSLIVHHRELKRTTNTGRLAIHALTNSEMYIRGESKSPLALTGILDPDYVPLLLFPSEHSVLLTPQLLLTFDRPVHLVVPDGNWRQAAKVGHRQKELKDVLNVHLQISERPNLGVLRKESSPFGMATLEAIAFAMMILESEKVGQTLLDLFRLKLSRTLEGRGLKSHLSG